MPTASFLLLLPVRIFRRECQTCSLRPHASSPSTHCVTCLVHEVITMLMTPRLQLFNAPRHTLEAQGIHSYSFTILDVATATIPYNQHARPALLTTTISILGVSSKRTQPTTPSSANHHEREISWATKHVQSRLSEVGVVT